MTVTPCVDRPTLLQLEDGALGAEEAGAVRAHLRACAACRTLAAELDALGAAAGRFAARRSPGGCPGEAVLAAYADGTLTPRERADSEAHFAACGRCVADLAALGRELTGVESAAGVEVAPAVRRAAMRLAGAAGLRPVPGPSGRLRWPVGSAASFPLAAAAAVAIIILAQVPPPGPLPPTTRGAGRQAAVELVTPTGGESLLASRGLLRWERAPGASQYTVTVVDASGAPLWTGRTTETWVALPAGLTLRPGASYSWWVSALLDSGEPIESEVARFTVSQ